MGFKERLKILRKEHGLTQNNLAGVLNYGYTAISNYESGRNEPSLEDLKKMAKYFNVSLDYIAGLNDIRNPYIEEILGEKVEDFIKMFLECSEEGQSEILLFLNWTLEKQKTDTKTRRKLKIAEIKTQYKIDD